MSILGEQVDEFFSPKKAPAHAPSTPAANLGGDGGKALSDAGFARMGYNDGEQGIVSGAAGYANDEAAGASTRGDQAVTDPRLAGNEASGADGHQAGAIELARRMAMGQAPSQGAYQLQAGLNQGSAQQASMATGARGSAALATAGANAGANTSNLQQNAFTQGGMLRSRDMAAGRGMLASGLGQKAGQDLNQLNSRNEMNAYNQDLNMKYGLDMGNAAVGLGGIENLQGQEDHANFDRGTRPGYAQDDAMQQANAWETARIAQINAKRAEDNA